METVTYHVVFPADVTLVDVHILKLNKLNRLAMHKWKSFLQKRL